MYTREVWGIFSGFGISGFRLPRFNKGALIIRIGFWAHFTITRARNHHKSIGIYLGPYITLSFLWVSGFRGLGFRGYGSESKCLGLRVWG